MQLENYPAYELGEIADNMALDKRCSLKTVLLVNLWYFKQYITCCNSIMSWCWNTSFSYSSSGYSRKQCINWDTRFNQRCFSSSVYFYHLEQQNLKASIFNVLSPILINCHWFLHKFSSYLVYLYIVIFWNISHHVVTHSLAYIHLRQ